ncbi:MAG: hypothetical protein GY759_16290 [Chloroflexi bacterium]|nr:hypothetical protein [Chloroflexota bacterium]
MQRVELDPICANLKQGDVLLGDLIGRTGKGQPPSWQWSKDTLESLTPELEDQISSEMVVAVQMWGKERNLEEPKIYKRWWNNHYPKVSLYALEGPPSKPLQPELLPFRFLKLVALAMLVSNQSLLRSIGSNTPPLGAINAFAVIPRPLAVG